MVSVEQLIEASLRRRQYNEELKDVGERASGGIEGKTGSGGGKGKCKGPGVGEAGAGREQRVQADTGWR